MSEAAPNYPNRRGDAAAEAIYGDKHAQFDPTSIGSEELAFVEELEAKQDVSVNPLGELAARQAIAVVEWANQHPDATQEQLDKMAKARL